jgi:hypothetical protein
MKAVAKQKGPELKPRHKKLRREFAEAHKDWTAKDWKRVIHWLMTAHKCIISDLM